MEFGVYKAGMINYQAKRFTDLSFVGFDSFEGLQEGWHGMVPEKTFDRKDGLPSQDRDGRRIITRLTFRFLCMWTVTPMPQPWTCWSSVLVISTMGSSFISTIISAFPLCEAQA